MKCLEYAIRYIPFTKLAKLTARCQLVLLGDFDRGGGARRDVFDLSATLADNARDQPGWGGGVRGVGVGVLVTVVVVVLVLAGWRGGGVAVAVAAAVMVVHLPIRQRDRQTRIALIDHWLTRDEVLEAAGVDGSLGWPLRARGLLLCQRRRGVLRGLVLGYGVLRHGVRTPLRDSVRDADGYADTTLERAVVAWLGLLSWGRNG